MKKCFVCKKEMDQDQENCNSCVDFFKMKYGDDYLYMLERFKLSLQQNVSLESTKSHGRYKNE